MRNASAVSRPSRLGAALAGVALAAASLLLAVFGRARVVGRQLSPRHDHEESDANARGLAALVGGFLASLLVVLVLVSWLFRGITGYPVTLHPPHGGVQPSALPALTAEPRLQPFPTSDLDEFRAAEDRQLSTYAWVDRRSGIVRIPLARALELTAERGLPARQPAAPGPRVDAAASGRFEGGAAR